MRRGDLGQQDHVHNVIFPAYCETGRAGIMRDAELLALLAGFGIFTARFSIDYRAELFWPGSVDIGTGIAGIGRSSVTFAQGLFQNGRCAATAQTVLVQVDPATRRPAPLGEAARSWLGKFLLD